MTGILMDLETGDPALDEYNNTTEISDFEAFSQVIDGIFNCKPGSEILHPTYGFPLEEAIRNGGTPDSDMFIESLVVQSLDPKIEKLIKSLDYVKAEISNRIANVNITITSIFDDVLTSEISLT